MDLEGSEKMSGSETFDMNFDIIPENRSWEECLKKGERIGGPSPWGNSKWSTFTQCPYKYYLKFVKRLRPVTPKKALEIGGLVHEMIGRYYDAKLDSRSEEESLDRAWDLCNRAADVTPEYAAEARRLMTAWFGTYAESGLARPEEKVVDVEVAVEVAEPFNYSSRLDAVLWRKGAYIHETKTASRMSALLLDGYEMNSQFLGQMYLWDKTWLKKEYGPLKGFIVDLIVKTKEVQLDRISVKIDPKQLRRWEKNMKLLSLGLKQCEVHKHWPQHMSNCTLYAQRCSYFNHCATGGSMKGLIKKKRGEY